MRVEGGVLALVPWSRGGGRGSHVTKSESKSWDKD